MPSDETTQKARILAEFHHEKLRGTAAAAVLDEEHRLPWVELDDDFRDACVETMVDLLDREVVEVGMPVYDELAHRTEVAAGRG